MNENIACCVPVWQSEDECKTWKNFTFTIKETESEQNKNYTYNSNEKWVKQYGEARKNIRKKKESSWWQ